MQVQEFFSTLSPSTAKAYKEDIADFDRWFEGTNDQNVVPEFVTSVDLREYQAHMIAVRGLRPATINRRLAAIRAWLSWAKGAGHVQSLPHFPRRVSEPKRAPRALRKVGEARFLRAVERGGNHRDSALVALMLFAGLRVSEAVRVQSTDIKISERKGRVIVRAGKGMKRREVPIGASGRAMVRPWLHVPKSGNWLFPGRNGRHLSVRAAQDMVEKYAYLSRLEDVTPHVLRHTFATRLIRAGVDIVIVAALLGHTRIDTTARYTQPEWTDLERATEQWR